MVGQMDTEIQRGKEGDSRTTNLHTVNIAY